MKRLFVAVLLTAAGLSRAASAADPATPAVELSRLALPEQNWSAMLKQGADQMRQLVESSAMQSGAPIPSDLSARMAEEYQRIMPTYQEVVDLQAGLLVKHYTEPELRELLAFYRTPLGQKAIRIMPEVSVDVSAYMMTLVQQRMPAMLERLKPMFEQAKAGAAAAPAAPAAKPAAKKPAAK